MSFKIVKHDAPNLKLPKFSVDAELAGKLNNFELTKSINKHHFACLLGKAGQGKSSLEIGLLQTPSMLKSVFHNIFLFCPPNSRASISNDFWAKHLPDEQIFDDVTIDNLRYVYDIAQENAREGFNTLIVFDDTQKYFKDNIEIQKLLLHMVNNRRHARLSIHMLCQNYFSIPKQVRQALTHLFIFKISKTEMMNIFNEHVEIANDLFNKILSACYKGKHDFLFIDTNTKQIFNNFDEVVYNA